MSDYTSEAGHWYKPDGTPVYTMIGANGKERNTTLRDAKKFGYYPSVTSIDCLEKPQLTKWKLEQIAKTCHASPVRDGEDCDAYADRILRFYATEGMAKKALDAGTDIHADIEKTLTEDVRVTSPEASAAIDELFRWCGPYDFHVEKSFAHPLGYGGKCDVHKDGFVADFKGKDFDEDWMPEVYENHWMQLAAYRQGFGMPNARCAIIYISRTVPGLARLVEIPQEDLVHGWKLFKALLETWKIKNRYNPALAKELENA